MSVYTCQCRSAAPLHTMRASKNSRTSAGRAQLIAAVQLVQQVLDLVEIQLAAVVNIVLLEEVLAKAWLPGIWASSIGLYDSAW